MPGLEQQKEHVQNEKAYFAPGFQINNLYPLNTKSTFLACSATERHINSFENLDLVFKAATDPNEHLVICSV